MHFSEAMGFGILPRLKSLDNRQSITRVKRRKLSIKAVNKTTDNLWKRTPESHVK